MFAQEAATHIFCKFNFTETVYGLLKSMAALYSYFFGVCVIHLFPDTKYGAERPPNAKTKKNLNVRKHFLAFFFFFLLCELYS